MDEVYLGNDKSTNGNWVDIDISGRTLHALEREEAIAKFRILSRFDFLGHHLKGMNLTDSHIYVFCNQNSILNSEYLFQCCSLNRESQQAKYKSSLYWEARAKMV